MGVSFSCQISFIIFVLTNHQTLRVNSFVAVNITLCNSNDLPVKIACNGDMT